MESAAMYNPTDEHILNKDDSITNKDGDSYLEKSEQPTGQNKPGRKSVSTVTPGNDNGGPGLPAEDKPSKKDAETKKYAL
ncbi:MAG: hypothetical protein JST50_11195 [Bacteroidetes bacterium]|jgi:hypothetical protein|nr:hypothetical protein [Bacteroidota bacterium]